MYPTFPYERPFSAAPDSQRRGRRAEPPAPPPSSSRRAPPPPRHPRDARYGRHAVRELLEREEEAEHELAVLVGHVAQRRDGALPLALLEARPALRKNLEREDRHLRRADETVPELAQKRGSPQLLARSGRKSKSTLGHRREGRARGTKRSDAMTRPWRSQRWRRRASGQWLLSRWVRIHGEAKVSEMRGLTQKRKVRSQKRARFRQSLISPRTPYSVQIFLEPGRL
jgi:hypothetical protein